MLFEGWLLMLTLGVLHHAGVDVEPLAYWHSVLVALTVRALAATFIKTA